ncbi:MAG: YabP/YqfC family sporulation protein [Oscillospiraceae bacterium]|nr:YabP/YqfC family sporulation protein [Oscillospiraceae bacterium]
MSKGRNRAQQPQNEPKPGGTLRELFDIPRAAIGGTLQIELSGNTEAIVAGCTGILEYDENVIRLAGNKLNVKFTGRSLQLKALDQTGAIVEGYIMSVEFFN